MLVWHGGVELGQPEEVAHKGEREDHWRWGEEVRR